LKRNRIFILSILLLAFACSPTVLLQEGKTKFHQGNKLNNLAVIALPGALMDVRVFEDAVTSRLNSKGVQVSAGYRVFELSDSVPADAISLRKALMEKGFNGMIEIKLVSIRNVSSSSEGDYPTRREYRIMDGGNNYGKLIQEYGKREEKGATFEDTKVKMDFRVIDLTQGEPQVIWSSRTETSNPGSAKNIAVGMSVKAIKVIKKQSILGE